MTVNRGGEITKRETKQAQYFRENLGEGVSLDMVDIAVCSWMRYTISSSKIDRERFLLLTSVGAEHCSAPTDF